jgi:hypothetical protein
MLLLKVSTFASIFLPSSSHQRLAIRPRDANASTHYHEQTHSQAMFALLHERALAQVAFLELASPDRAFLEGLADVVASGGQDEVSSGRCS